jgi:hypothetical protein
VSHGEWRECCETTVLETNPTQLQKLTRDTEVAIFRRMRELHASSDGAEERHEIAGASAALRALKTEHPEWPNPKQIRIPGAK